MFEKILPLLNKLVPTDIAVKAIEKKAPQFTSFLAQASAYGYTASDVLSYFRNQLEPEKGEGNERPDELAAKKMAKQSRTGTNLLGTAAKGGALAGGALAVSGLAGAEALPTVLKGMFKGKKEPGEGVQSLANEFQDVIAAVKKHVDKGMSLRDAELEVRVDPSYAERLKEVFKKISKPYFIDFLQEVFSNSKQNQQQPQIPQGQPAGQKSNLSQMIAEGNDLLKQFINQYQK